MNRTHLQYALIKPAAVRQVKFPGGPHSLPSLITPRVRQWYSFIRARASRWGPLVVQNALSRRVSKLVVVPARSRCSTSLFFPLHGVSLFFFFFFLTHLSLSSGRRQPLPTACNSHMKPNLTEISTKKTFPPFRLLFIKNENNVFVIITV